MRIVDLTGQKFGKLTVIERSDKRAPRGRRTVPLWKCQYECGNIVYKATDSLKNKDVSMCRECAATYTAQHARKSAGFVGGTQITKLQDMSPTQANTSGQRGVYYDKKAKKYRVRLRFQRKLMSFGSVDSFEDAVVARKTAEQAYFGRFLENVQNKKGLELK